MKSMIKMLLKALKTKEPLKQDGVFSNKVEWICINLKSLSSNEQ